MPIDDDALLVDLGGFCPLDISDMKLYRNRYGLPKFTDNFARNRAWIELVLTESGLTRSADSEGKVEGGRGMSPRMRLVGQGRSEPVDEVGVAYEGGRLAPPCKGAAGLYRAVEMDAVRLEPTEINVGDIAGHVVAVEVEHQIGGTGWEMLGSCAWRSAALGEATAPRGWWWWWWCSGPQSLSTPAGLAAAGPGATPAGLRRTATPPPRLAGTP